jgi:hypothetical protein
VRQRILVQGLPEFRRRHHGNNEKKTERNQMMGFALIITFFGMMLYGTATGKGIDDSKWSALIFLFWVIGCITWLVINLKD